MSSATENHSRRKNIGQRNLDSSAVRFFWPKVGRRKRNIFTQSKLETWKFFDRHTLESINAPILCHCYSELRSIHARQKKIRRGEQAQRILRCGGKFLSREKQGEIFTRASRRKCTNAPFLCTNRTPRTPAFSPCKSRAQRVAKNARRRVRTCDPRRVKAMLYR